MLVVAAYVATAVLPALLFRGAWIAILRWSQAGPWRRSPTAAAERTLEGLAADLRRLEQDFRRTEQGDLPYRAARLQAISLAYDDTLRICCRVLEVPEPDDRTPWPPFTRLAIEAELARAGLAW